jgi:hypothetical protein
MAFMRGALTRSSHKSQLRKENHMSKSTSNVATPATRKPSHRVFCVTRRSENDKARWDDIGAAWAQKDGKGFNLKLNYLPLNGGELVIRLAEDTQKGGAQ